MIAFVLSGGGSLGALQAGMLEALIEEGITPDAVIGTSIDLELAGNCSDRPGREPMFDELLAFVEEVERAGGRRVILYLGNDFEEYYGVTERLDRPLWLRRFLLEPSTKGWYIWQLHGYALIDGIEGGADLDVMRERFGP